MTTAFSPFASMTVPLVGTNLVEASAGTGKTYAITTLFVRLLLQRQLDIERILVVTFTEAATTELRDRVRARLREAAAAFECHAAGRPVEDDDLRALIEQSADPGADQERLETALRNADLAAIFTIHGFCHRVLHESAFESGALFDAEMLTDTHPLREEVVGDYWATALAPLPVPLVRRLRDVGLEFKKFLKLADKAVSHPEAPLLPLELEAVSVPAPSDFESAFEAARAAWSEAAVRELLSDAVRMNRNKYREDSVIKWCAEMSAYLAGDTPAIPGLIEKHAKFCTATLAESTKRGQAPPDHPFFGACDQLATVVAAFEAAARHHVLELHKGLVDYARAELPRRKEQKAVLSFDDLLHKVWIALRSDAGAALARSVRRRYPAALIDEFQDTDPIQYEIFEKIYADADHSLFLVGDPKQAIYSFRGADVFAYMRAASATPEDRRFTMGHNWRSGPRLVEAINFLWSRVDEPFLLRDIGYPSVEARPGARDVLVAPGREAPLEIVFVPRGEDKHLPGPWLANHYPDLVAAEISELLRSGALVDGEPLQTSDIAVLTRTNAQAFAVQDALRRLRIPSVVLGDQSVFESSEAEELQRVLATVVEPGSGGALRTALATELLGVTAGDIARMEEDQQEWEEWVADFRAWNETWSTRGFVQMFRALMARRGVQTRLLSLSDGERRMTNVLHLVELLHTAATTQHLGPAGLLHWLAQQRANARARPEAAQIRLESDERAVRLTTVHRSKGLEYGVVFCPYLWEGWLLHSDDKTVLQFHDAEDDNRLKLEVGADKDSLSYARAEWEKLAENLRLLYVALTRAKYRCTVFWGAPSDFETSALGYLLHPPSGGGDVAVQVLKQHLKARNDDRLWEEVEQLARDSGGLVAARRTERRVTGEPLATTGASAPELARREIGKRVERWWRTASFSQLASGATSVDLDDGRERDEAADDVLPDDEAVGAAGPTETPIQLAGFPRGARAGNFFHDVLEHVDFRGPDPELVRRTLESYGYLAETWQAPVERALDAILATPLRAAGDQQFCLADIASERRLNELEFHLPVAGDDDHDHFTQRSLAEVFRAHPSPALSPDYADQLTRLRFVPLQGFLKGYVDLIFEHHGRWYVVDYKSNYLGEHVEDYAAPRLQRAMAHGHYYLQYHLYAVALHRYLGRRLPGYDYDADFGGVFYLFLRGMTPAVPGAGVFYELPPRARIEGLSARLERPSGGGA